MRGLPLPVPQQYKGLVEVTVDAWNALKLAVVEAFNEANITKNRIGTSFG